MRKSKRIVTRTLAFTKKEFKLATRYKWSYISVTVIAPILAAMPLVVLYLGIVTAVPGGVQSVNPANYLPWVLLGSVFYTVFVMGFSGFRIKFSNEKYWMTIYGTLIAPVSKYYLLFGEIIELSLRATVTSVLFIVISYIALPTAFINLFLVYIVLFLTIVAGVGIGLMNGTVYLINENLAPLFGYGLFFISFLSCYSIPYELYPEFLQFFVLANPFFHCINLSRDIWFMNLNINSLYSFLYVLIFAIVALIIGVYSFKRLTRRYGVHGY